MADNKDIFTSTVVPIMDKVRDDLQRKQADEYERHSRSWGAMMAGAAGPDGGMASMDAYNSTILYTGEWNTKTVEDYIDMVKAELKKKGIAVDAVLEKKMIDHLIHQQMPKSTVEYILRKAAEGTIFYLPQRARQQKAPSSIFPNVPGHLLYKTTSIKKQNDNTIHHWLQRLQVISFLGLPMQQVQAVLVVS